MSGKKLLQYDDGSKEQFETYFIKPKKRGRPKNKKKRGRPKAKVAKAEKKQAMMQQSESGHEGAPIDLTAKQKDELDARLEGTVAKSRRQKLQRINWDAPEDVVDELPIPDYPTQDEVFTEVSEADDETEDEDSVSIAMTIDKFKDLTTGEGVQVYWASEGEWYEGEVIEIDETDQTFHIHYVTGEKLWHPFSDFKVRYAC